MEWVARPRRFPERRCQQSDGESHIPPTGVPGSDRRSPTVTRGHPDHPRFLVHGRPALLAIALLAATAACEIGFVDRGGSFVADNRSDTPVFMRLKKTVAAGSGSELEYSVVEVPASSVVVLDYQGFADGEQLHDIEVMTESCLPIGRFVGWEKGRIRIDDGPIASQIREFPDESEPRAVEVDTCPLPTTSPAPS